MKKRKGGGFSVEVLGEVAVRRALRDAPDKLRRGILNGSTKKASKVGVRYAQSGAPRRSGKLRRNIKNALDHPNTDRYRVTYQVGPNVGQRWSRKAAFYGVILERGSKPRRWGKNVRKGKKSKGAGKSTGRVRATWWLKRSYLRAKPAMTRIMANDVSRWAHRLKSQSGERMFK